MSNERVAAAIAVLISIVLVAACARAPARKQASPAPEGPPRAAAAEAPVPEYRLGPGDTLKITVYNNADLTTETVITQAGNISFPLIGEVGLGGLSRSEAEKAIAAALDRGGFVPKPHVTLLIIEYRSQQVSILGEVGKPGVYPLSQVASLTDVLAMAGGITDKGSSVVTIIRRDQSAKAERYQVDVKNVFAAADMTGNFNVARGDIIYVPPVSVFYIYGEVHKPGRYPLAPEMTVRQALSVGGGLTVRGTERGIKLERKGGDGKLTLYGARLTDRLQPNDVVQVPEGWF